MPPSSSSSRRSRRRSARSSALSSVRRRLSRRRIIAGLLVLAGLYVLVTGFFFMEGTTSYLDVDQSDDQTVVLYVMGYPSAVREGPQTSWVRTQPVSMAAASTALAVPGGQTVNGYANWAYTLAEGGQAQFEFDANGQVSRISCLHPEAIASACPSILGVKLGDDEFRPLWKLGNPSRSETAGLTRTFYYDDLGIEYGLERRRIYRMAINRRSGGPFAHVMRYLRSRVP